MKEPNLRKWHRWLGIIVAPLLFLQAISGIILSVDWLFGIHQRAGEVIKDGISPLAQLWDIIFVLIHYGFGVGGSLYHVALGIGTALLSISGFMIFLKIRARLKKAEGE